MSADKIIRLRVYLCFMGMCLFALAILVKGSMVIFKEGPQLKAYADSLYTDVQVLQPERGNIYTEDGSLLSSSIPEFDIRLDLVTVPKDTFNKYINSLSKGLATILSERGKSATDYKLTLQKQQKKGNQYYLLARKVSYSQYIKIKKLQPFVKGANKGGFMTESHIKRINPFGILANRTVGIHRQNAQNVGLEDSFNEHLKGEEGRRIVRKIAGGAFMPIDGSEVDPVNGKDVVTTLDMNIQDVAENALMKQLKIDQAAFGTCVVMETKTGKIKAMANLGRQADGSYYEDKNYALLGIEPGSTCKVISLISLLNDEKTKIDKRINCSNTASYRIGKRRITDSHPVGTVSVENALAQSSNIGFFKMIYHNYKNDKDAYINNLKKLNLHKPTGIEINGESKTNLNESRVHDEEYLIGSMGYGYGIKLTPMHLCMVYNAIANNGKMMKPYLVKEVKEYGNTLHSFEPQVLNATAVKQNAVEDIKNAMHAVVERGTGKKLRNPYYNICGKTGTARVVDKGIKYSDRVYHASFIGFFPKEDPQYTIAVVVRTSKNSKNYYGGLLALPVFQEVANRLYATHVKTPKTYVTTDSMHRTPELKKLHATQFSTIASALGMKTRRTMESGWIQSAKEASDKKWDAEVIKFGSTSVPNVRGMGLRNAMTVLESRGLRVIPVGKGKVARQSLEAGASIIKGQTITIHLG
jgi:cell division protein FtsI (penicillin-binding protein 3)